MKTPLLTLKNLSLTYPHKVIFKEAFFVLNQGDRIGVLGLNGHGKSSLFKILNKEATPDHSVPPFLFDRVKESSLFLVPQELPLEDTSRDIENYLYIFYPEIDVRMKRLKIIEEKLTQGTEDMDPLLDSQANLYQELEQLGYDRLINSYMSYLKLFELDPSAKVISLSGGEQRKVALSLGLSAPHAIILWDEPTNHLDLSTIELFEDELRQSNKTFMLITHDRTLLNNIAERIVHIQHGQIKSFEGTYAAYLEFLQEEEKKRLSSLNKLSNYHRRETAWISRGAKARRTKSKKRIEEYQNLSQAIQELKSLAHSQVSLQLKKSQRQTKVLVEGTDISFSYGDKVIFENLNVTLQKGDKIGLIGDNGQGKSTLLKIMNGELLPTAGKLRRAENLGAGFFSQKREQLNPDITPWELIGEGIDYVISNTGEKKHVAGYLENFLFSSEELRRPIKTFSGGEKNRLQLAQFMKHAMDLWIFDEPTNDLDLETIGILEEELKNYSGALIIVGHDRAFLENVCTQFWWMHDGVIDRFYGDYSQVESYREILTEAKRLENEKANQSSQSPTKSKTGQIEQQIQVLEKQLAETQDQKKSKKLQQQIDQLYQEWEANESSHT